MKQTFSDFSQLKKGMFKAAPAEDEAKPEPSAASGLSGGDEEVLAYFSRPTGGDPQKPVRRPAVCAPVAKTADARPHADEGDTTALCGQLREAENARKAAEDRLAEANQKCADMAAELAAGQKELARVQGEVGRLRGELKKAEMAAPVRGDPNAEQLPAPACPSPASGVLAAPAAFVEAFPGELREMVLSVLSDARDAARQSTRERRAAVLEAVLAANRPTGELERRRAELKQILKDAGYYTDPHALEDLGFKLVSGRTHWKLEYAGVRMPIAKTPSDYRANLNMAADMANKCF